ncbi:hypothetical protein TNCT_568731 [Trichonephila clavata]|uniref:Uncharacterized protein n=1 Tax=Trichonephila clavata TaxID=2740835 RepID=A0A8X6HEG0_TRICU|nr:hypothetical protein TNCT_568731 [Trichonephila clavata]
MWVEIARRNSLHDTVMAVYRRNEWSTNPPLRHYGRTLGGPSRLLHDTRSVERDCSTEFLQLHGNGRVTAERMVRQPTA